MPVTLPKSAIMSHLRAWPVGVQGKRFILTYKFTVVNQISCDK